MGSVVLEEVTKRFGDTVAVDDLSLEVRDEEFLVLVGPSGCGKSTALRMIAGLDDPTDGVVRIDGRIVNHVEPKDRDVAMVFQDYALYPHMTVRRNVEFPLRTRSMDRDERQRVVTEAAETLGLGEFLDRKPAQLSGGQRQRVALARAIVRRPEAFLMDEPLSNLDAKLRVATRTELVELQRRLGTTVVYVTHDQVEAMTMGSRIAILNEGALEQIGPPPEIYRRPASVFVARFIGSPPMNTAAGPVRGEPGALRVVLPGGEIALTPHDSRTVAGSGCSEIVVGIRPEHVTVNDAKDGATADGAAGDASGIPASVLSVEALGYERHVICRLDDGTTMIARISTDGPEPPAHSAVRLGFDTARLHFFDPATTRRIDG
ncbi:MAG: sn-glycerol-3-phosphate ABC transporter ATP-binding protein UgpC [Acidimicrobiia bacterium]|nr:sn-glycerol-3-phosphate ABC transporter ATP-binding protein UgpC [Acidimicrobiia bacterium]